MSSKSESLQIFRAPTSFVSELTGEKEAEHMASVKLANAQNSMSSDLFKHCV